MVSAAKVAEFAALGDGGNAAYAGPDAVALPTFAVVLSSAAWGRCSTTQSWIVAEPGRAHRPAVQLGVVRCGWVTRYRHARQHREVRARGSSAFITIVVALDAGGERICDATSTLLHTWPEEVA